MQQSVTTIEGDHVLLRPFQEGDAEEAARVWTPELRHMYGGSLTAPAASIEERRAGKRAWFERIQRGEEGHCFAIEADGRYVGFVGLRVNDEEQSGRYRIGIENPEYWGRGCGTEVTRLMLRYAFETLNLHRVSLRVAAYNARAIRSYEKAGFRWEGVERDSFFVDGEWHDDVLMAILKQEWERMEERPEDGLCYIGPEDVDEVLALWTKTELWPHIGEDRRSAAEALASNRDFAFGWRASDELVATAIGAFDGFRGWIYRVAVHPDHRR